MHWGKLAIVLFAAGCASAGDDDYAIVQERATIPYGANTVSGYAVDERKSLILDVRRERYFRAQLESRCRDRLVSTPSVGFLPEGGADVKAGVRLDIDGEKCRIERLDEIKRPTSTGAP